MKASGSKPPGTTAFNIEPVVDEQGSDEHVEVLDSLPLGAMAFGDLEPDQIDPSNKWMELTAPVDSALVAGAVMNDDLFSLRLGLSTMSRRDLPDHVLI